jgi:hypothetical protein
MRQKRGMMPEAGEREGAEFALVRVEAGQAGEQVGQEVLGEILGVMRGQPEAAAQAARDALGHAVQRLEFGEGERGHRRLRLVDDDQPKLPEQLSHRGGTGVGRVWECRLADGYSLIQAVRGRSVSR